MGKLLTCIAMIAMLAGSAYCLPLSLKGELTSSYGEILTPGSLVECEYLNELRISRPFEVSILKGITITPYLEGQIYNENAFTDLALTVITAGCEADILENLTIGAKRSWLDYQAKDSVESYDSAYLKITF